MAWDEITLKRVKDVSEIEPESVVFHVPSIATTSWPIGVLDEVVTGAQPANLYVQVEAPVEKECVHVQGRSGGKTAAMKLDKISRIVGNENSLDEYQLSDIRAIIMDIDQPGDVWAGMTKPAKEVRHDHQNEDGSDMEPTNYRKETTGEF